MAQLGTSSVGKGTFLWLALGVGGLFAACADLSPGEDAAAHTDEDADVSPGSRDGGSGGDASVDADASDVDADASDVDASDDGASPVTTDADMCSASSKKLQDFIAQHRSCSVDSDCAIVGDCSHADFQAVQRAHQDEAQRLALATCNAFDGPTYNAVCRAGQCERLRAAASCGGVAQTECPAGTTRRYPGCSETKPTFAEGCYADCSGVGNNAGCAAGYTCQKSWIDPCRGKSCDACGQEVTLCLPAPACEVEVVLGFDYGKPLVKLASDQSTQLELWLNNKTNRTLSLSFDVPCPGGPVVSGLGDYDLWNTCVAGVCQQPTQRVQVSLKPEEKLRWRTAVVQPAASSCNPEGLAAGTYAPSFSLPITGAVTCGTAPAGLVVSP